MSICSLIVVSGLLLGGSSAQIPGGVAPPASTLFVPIADPDYVWEEVADVIDNYFRIQTETRAQIIGNVMTEGRISTYPEIAATLLEPWRRDVVTFYDRLEATFQTIRRYAEVRVIPAQGGYVIDVAVFKQLEDLPRPAMTMSGAATFRIDMSVSRFNEPIGPQTTTLGWIGLGRDPALEQKILCKLQSRLFKNIGGPFAVTPIEAGPPCNVPPTTVLPGSPPMVLPEPVPSSASEPPRQLVPAAGP